jgi:flagellar hook assembly protein FlgD
LKQNYPNPFNPSTLIDFEVFESSEVSLSVYDLSGRLVKNLLSSNLNSGAYSVEWNGKNTNGVSAAAGVYFYSISSKESTIIKKMSLIK